MNINKINNDSKNRFMNFIKSIDIKCYEKISFLNKKRSFKAFYFFGSFLSVFLFILIFYFMPVNKNIDIMIISTLSFILNTIIVFILKYTVKRKRYFNCYENNVIKKYDPYSFPSGHSARLSGFIISTIYFPLLTIIFIILTFFISILRISKGYHYLTDCIAGIIIGLLTGLLSFIIYNIFYNNFAYFINLL